MGYGVELKPSTRQQEASKVMKEKAISPRANLNRKFQDKHRVENTFGQLFIERCRELRKNAGDVPVVPLKHSGDRQKQWSGSDTTKNDELVKHMSNLPGYLQKIERGENLQEKALNFGVLDWKHLEKWKYNEKFIPARDCTKTSSSGSNSSFMAGGSSTISHSKTYASQRKQPSAHGWRHNSAHEERQGVRSQAKVTKAQGFETGPWSTIDGKRNLRMKDKSSGSKFSEIQLDRGKRRGSNHITTSVNKTASVDRKKHGLQSSSHETTKARDCETIKIVEKEFDFALKSCGHKSIVLLLPEGSSDKSCSKNIQLPKSKTPSDGNFAEAKGKRFSGCFSPEEELHSVKLYSEIQHYCPLPPSVAKNIESNLEQCSLVNSQCVQPQFDRSHIHQRPKEVPNIPSNNKCLEVSSSKKDPSTTAETPKRLGQNIAEQPNTKGRHPSPGQRFSFSSLGKLTRSLSFKEGLAVATVESGPEASTVTDKLNQDNVSTTSRASSSPLRRLLNPLLKPRGTETVKPLKVNSKTLSFKPMNTSELLQNQKNETSSVQALLQLTLKNGLPLFKLVVNNSSDILAATIKQLPKPGEDASRLIYTLYSVHEIKKKGGSWMNQASKGIHSSFGYNIIGQMKVSSSFPLDLNGQNMNDQYVARESVLYSVDIGQADKETPEFKPSKELAAIVIKNPIPKINGGEQRNNSNLCSQEKFAECFLENTGTERKNEDSNSITVILGGVHGLPYKGLPSPLLNLWTYDSGSCDCGGWDVDCKLQILTNQDQNSKNFRPSISCSIVECLDLFVEGGDKEKKPIFSLAPFKSGVYSVEFKPSISLLQAFFISVAFLSSQNIFEVKMEAKNFTEPKSDTMKIPDTIQGQIPAKYVTNPTPSPVGRV